MEYELSEGESINIMDSADPIYISSYTIILMLSTARAQGLSRKRNTERKDCKNA